MIRVYRVQNSKAVGPYNGEKSLQLRELLLPHYAGGVEEHTHPSAVTDVDDFRCGMLCGFGSLDALRRWFSNLLDTLTDNGYRVAVYTVPSEDVFTGFFQWAFCPKQATCVEEFGLED